VVLLAVLGLGGLPARASEEGPLPREATREEIDLFLGHLRAHFDDIHDVSMRFHADDPWIDGTITLGMTFRQGRLEEGEVLANDTGSPEEGRAMLDAVRGWTIPGLEGPARLTIPLRIKLVGSDEPEFPHTAIVTGVVVDAGGAPVRRARITFRARGAAARVPDARTSRDGVFVRTLVPPGSWDLTCAVDGKVVGTVADLRLSAGEHRRVDFAVDSASLAP
jgi:hypothetical protein